MRNWGHPGFSVYQGERIDPDHHEARQRLAGYIVHLLIVLERLRYPPESGQVLCHDRQRERCGYAGPASAPIFPAVFS